MANQSQSEQYAFNAFANLPFYSSINSEFIEDTTFEIRSSNRFF